VKESWRVRPSIALAGVAALMSLGLCPKAAQADYIGIDPTRELLENSVRVKANFRFAGSIEATFQPNLGFTLAETAQILGFDHFNWIQHVISVPDQWTIKRYLAGHNPSISGIVLHPPLIDPDTLYPSSRIAIASGHAKNWSQLGLQDSVDHELFYFNDALQHSVFDRGHFTTATTMSYFDAPESPPLFFAPGEFMQFETQLAGVQSDGTYITWTGLGTNFTWKSDAMTDGTHNVIVDGSVFGISYFITADDGTLPRIVSGRVFDVVLDSGQEIPSEEIPEPPTSLLFTLACCGLLAGRLLYIRRMCDTLRTCPTHFKVTPCSRD
jgi:hypothetical protein